ncbi:cytochrome P450 [Cubamyces menziesii]|nr:cytochrome P450 [Cubamyces menziesii]
MQLVPPPSLPTFWAIVISLFGLLYVYRATKWRNRTRGRPLPPGPKRLPLIGSMLSMPTWKPWIGFRDLSKTYGDVVYLEVLGRPVIVLGKPDVMMEFLDKRSAITSDRVQTVLMDLVGQENNFSFIPNDNRWRRQRRAFWQHFHPSVVPKYQPIQRDVTRKMLLRLLEAPERYQDIIHYVFSAAPMKAVYDIDLKDETDELIGVLESLTAGLRQVTISAQFLLEFLPLVAHLPTWAPGTNFLRKLKASRAPSDRIMHDEFAKAKARVVSRTLERGEDDSSVISQLVADFTHASEPNSTVALEEEDTAKCVAAVAVEGKSQLCTGGLNIDSTFSTGEGFFFAMSLHPEVQEKARAELDAIVGSHRLPDFEDRDALVYVNAIVKESFRWHNVVPLGVGHRTVEDTELNGYFIPAGTGIIPNVWAVLHDPDIYPEPDRFYPERFIRDGKLDPDVLDPASLVFGFGRRICPGRHFADAMLFIVAASVLHLFDIGPPRDDDGNPIKVKMEQSHGFLSYPEDCRCVVKPRSAAAEALIRSSVSTSTS